ncbi:MAG: MBL fold metallo-hydrolase [Bacteroidota bacterium]
MKNFLTILCLIPLASFAQDKLETKSGAVTIHPITHGTMVLQHEGKTIYVDPYGGAEGFKNFSDPDLILITDIHGDHLNKETLKALNTNSTTFIVPQAVHDQIEPDYGVRLKVLNNGSDLDWNGINIAAIPMYNLPETEDSRHPKGRGNGYVLTIGGKKIYISGDTEDIPEMRDLKGIDVAFVCMNLPYTMDINQAASAVLDFKPKVVYPYHYRGQGGLSDVAQFKDIVIGKNAKIEVRLGNWYPNN